MHYYRSTKEQPASYLAGPRIWRFLQTLGRKNSTSSHSYLASITPISEIAGRTPLAWQSSGERAAGGEKEGEGEYRRGGTQCRADAHQIPQVLCSLDSSALVSPNHGRSRSESTHSKHQHAMAGSSRSIHPRPQHQILLPLLLLLPP